MSMTPREETKSFRVCSQNDKGVEVFGANATYSSRGIFVSFEMFDQNYCKEHVEDVQEAISSFISRLNGLLEETKLPIIHTQKEAHTSL